MSFKGYTEYDVAAATRDILTETFEKQLLLINASREQIAELARVMFGWIDQIVDLSKMLATLAVSAILAGSTIEANVFNGELLFKMGCIVLIISILLIIGMLLIRRRFVKSLSATHTANIEFITTLSETLRLYNQHIDLKHAKAKGNSNKA